MSNGMLLIVGALAAWTLTLLLVYENGPYLVFLRIRLLVGVEHFSIEASGQERLVPSRSVIDAAKDGTVLHRITVGKNELAKLFTCYKCMSVWTGLFSALVASLGSQWPIHHILLLALAYSAFTIVTFDLWRLFLSVVRYFER